jgi:hypothetical protein
MFGILKRVFSPRTTPEGLMTHFRQQAEVFEGEQANLSFQLRRHRSRIEAILNRGKEAARIGDSLGKRAAAMELKGAQLEVGAVERDLVKVLNARTFARLTLRKLERCARTQLGRAYEGLSRLMADDSFKQLMVEARFHGQEAEAKIGAALDRVFEELPEDAVMSNVDTSIFNDLATADEAGDVEKVKELKRKAGARAELTTDAMLA